VTSGHHDHAKKRIDWRREILVGLAAVLGSLAVSFLYMWLVGK
jgi:hypothetical protein